jgi:PAP2 superfamily
MPSLKPSAGPALPPSRPEGGPALPPIQIDGGPALPPLSVQQLAGRGTPISQITAYQSTTGSGVFLRALDHLNYTTPVKASRHQDQAALTAALKKQRPEVLRLQALGSNLRMLVARAPLTTALLVTQTKGACTLTVGDQTHPVSYPAAQQKAALQHVQDQLRLGELSLPFIAAEAEDPSWAFVHALGLHRLPTHRFTHTLELMAIVNDVVVAPVHQLKHALNIPRPDVLLPKLRPWLPTPPHTSFPSGHAMYAHAVAVVLAALTGAHDPKALTQLASAVAQRRELAGLHTALDTAMGQTLGQAIGQWLVKEATKSRAPELAAWRTLFVMAGLEWSGREVA